MMGTALAGLLHYVQGRIDDPGVELDAPQRAELVERALEAEARSVRTVRAHRVDDVGAGDDLRLEDDLRAT
jgi:hypothetical protein